MIEGRGSKVEGKTKDSRSIFQPSTLDTRLSTLHRIYFFFFETGVNGETATAATGWFDFVTFICKIPSAVLTVM
jgi:hypothetical protein